jgi:hydrogenase maturation protease
VVRVIGIGAEDRGDDAAGLLVARGVRAAAPPGVEIVESPGDAGDLLTLLDGVERVVLVDAARGGGMPGAVELVPAGSAPRSSSRSTHGLGVAVALELAAALRMLPACVRLYVVHGAWFDTGPVSPPVAAAIGVAARRILRDELGQAVRAPGGGTRAAPTRTGRR